MSEETKQPAKKQGKEKDGGKQQGQGQGQGHQQGKQGRPSTDPNQPGQQGKDHQSKPHEKGNQKAGPPKQGQSQSNTNTSSGSNRSTGSSNGRLALFDHLPRKVKLSSGDSIEGDRVLHPSTVRLGLMIRQGIIRDDDDRSAALIALLCDLVDDYKTPTNKSLSHDLQRYLTIQVQHLVNCRQLCMGMGNIIKYIKQGITRLSSDTSEYDAKQTLRSLLQVYLEESLYFARIRITEICSEFIRANDIIVTYGSSPLLRQIFLETSKLKTFKLIIVDSRPLNDGLLTLEELSPCISCVYTTLSGANAALRDATKVILSASALLSNGAMLAPAGTAMVASLARAINVPVIVACEGYKFCEKVQVDPIVYNELGSSSEIALALSPDPSDPSAAPSEPQRAGKYLGAAGSTSTGSKNDEIDTNATKLPFQVVNLRYDLTPIGNISAVATETGLIPPTSIPALLREFKDN